MSSQMLSVLTAGLPLVGKELLSTAIIESFGEGVINIIELTKDNLRQRVRLSQKDVSTILVVLDRVSSDLCADIENGLYESDKYHTYVDERDFVLFLNKQFNLSLEVPVEDNQLLAGSDDIQLSVSQEVLEKYEARIIDYRRIIDNLQGRVSELQKIIDEGMVIAPQEDRVSSEELEELQRENLELKNKILDIENSSSNANSELVSVINERDALRETIKKIEEKRNTVLAEYKLVMDELTELKVNYSTQSGVIRAKNTEIQTLQDQLVEMGNLKSSLAVLAEEKKAYEENLNALKLETSNLKVDLLSKDSEITRLSTEVKSGGVTTEMVASLKEELQQVISERDTLSKDYQIAKSKLKSSEEDVKDINSRMEGLAVRVGELEAKAKEDDNNLSQLNIEKLELQAKVRVLEKSTSRDTDIESLMQELTELRRNYDNLSNGIFGKISSFTMPKGSTPVHLTRKGARLNNVRFTFAGSTESRKGAYKCLLEEFKELSSSEHILIVDVVSETAIDYVFEIKRMVSGVDWFRKGGGVQPYLSSTCLKNVQVLSPGLGYVNDSYFLSIDWESRLTELENSGYRVVVFCGDISNIVGRVMHESFADIGNSIVYVHGNAIGSRTIVSNLRGLTNNTNSIIAYFEFDTKMRKFYDLVSKTNECRVLSVVSGRR